MPLAILGIAELCTTRDQQRGVSLRDLHDDATRTGSPLATKVTRHPLRLRALLHNRAFLVDYAAARAGWHTGVTVIFSGHVLVAAVGNVAIAAA
jgi:hypothetical protein